MVLSLAINISVKGGSAKSDNPELNRTIEKSSKSTARQMHLRITIAPQKGIKIAEEINY